MVTGTISNISTNAFVPLLSIIGMFSLFFVAYRNG